MRISLILNICIFFQSKKLLIFILWSEKKIYNGGNVQVKKKKKGHITCSEQELANYNPL